MILVNRQQAIADGNIKYFTGKPCKYGHISERYVSTSQCYECTQRPELLQKKKEKSRQWKIDNPRIVVLTADQKAEKSARRARQIAENKDHFKKKWAESRERNKNARKEWAGNNKPLLASLARAWRSKNPDKIKAINATRRSRQSDAEGRHGCKDIRRILAQQAGLCVYCSAALDNNYHVDHILPLYLGGSNWPSNIQILCPTCNLRKGRKHPDRFEAEIGFTRN